MTLPYVEAIADKGVARAIAEDAALAKGVNVVGGKITYEAVAQAHGLSYTPLADAIEQPRSSCATPRPQHERRERIVRLSADLLGGLRRAFRGRDPDDREGDRSREREDREHVEQQLDQSEDGFHVVRRLPACHGRA